MTKFSITRARRFLKGIQQCPLLENIGEAVGDDSVALAKTFAQFSREYKSSSKALNVTQNHGTARQIDGFGFPWFQERREDQFDAVKEEMERT